MNIRVGTATDFAACRNALRNSEVGQIYFVSDESMNSLFTESMQSSGFWVAVDDDDKVLGHICFLPNGMFGRFPYLRNIAVQPEMRGKGIGKALLEFFEANSFANAQAVFLLVSDFNMPAQQLYESHGYTYAGQIGGLFHDSITELLMMKLR